MGMKREGKNRSPKNLIVFILTMLVSLVVGFIVGMVIAYAKKNGMDFAGGLSALGNNVSPLVPYVYLVISVVSFVVSLTLYIKYSRMAVGWDGETEDIIEEVETKLNVPVGIASIMMIVNIIFFTLHVWFYVFTDMECGNLIRILGLVLFFANYAWTIVINHLVVELEKKLNPEKRGEVFENNFSKKWEASCDEAQKKIIYEAGFRAYKAGNMACSAMWLVTFLSMFALDTGLLPVFAVCTIWLVMTACYIMVSARLEKGMYQ